MSFASRLKIHASNIIGGVRKQASQLQPNVRQNTLSDAHASEVRASRRIADSHRMEEIFAQREALRQQAEIAANNGVVPDALPRSIFANYFDEAAEWRRLHGEEWQQLNASLRRLDAMFPETLPSEPEPAASPRPKVFPRLGDLLARHGSGLPH